MMSVQNYLTTCRELNNNIDGLSTVVHHFIGTLPRPILSLSKESDDPCLIASLEDLEDSDYTAAIIGLKDISGQYPVIEPFSEEHEHAIACVEDASVIDMYFENIKKCFFNDGDVLKEKGEFVQQKLSSLAHELRDIDISHHTDSEHLKDTLDFTALRVDKFIKNIETISPMVVAEKIIDESSGQKDVHTMVLPKDKNLVLNLMEKFDDHLDAHRVPKRRARIRALFVKKLNSLGYFTGRPEAFHENDNISREAKLEYLHPLLKEIFGITLGIDSFKNDHANTEPLIENYEVAFYQKKN